MEEVTQEVVEIKDPKAVLDALDRAKADAKRFREEKEAMELTLSSQEQKIAEYSGKLLREQVKKNLKEQNITNIDRLLKYVDFEKLNLDEDFNVSGLNEQVSELKTDFPEFFDPKLLVAGKADSADALIVNAQLSVSDRQAKLLLGN